MEKERQFHCNHIGVADSLIFFNTMDGTLSVMDKRDGTELWKFKSNGKTYSRAISVGSIVYFGSGDGNLYAINLHTGGQIWKFEVGSPVDRMTIDKGMIFFGSGNHMFAIE